ncbi:MAG TPA: carbamoyltransferase HypF [Sulfurovum sp.]|uniref:carbamoyltransferase HypF n=1 Tax=Sulfurovum sp. TaxID=1969726 RepID=UPI002F94E221
MNRRLHITGIVQGVGFRPFVYQLARRYHLHGYIVNTAAGVTVEAEGEEGAIEAFMGSLKSELPPLARLDTLTSENSHTQGYTDFRILQSERQSDRSALVSPDSAVCEKCLQEMNDPSDRRYGYPFINCTDCGPRYSIMETLPYDRPNTSMHRFAMCKSCHDEYSDPLDRRFHAQPISCPNCGPTLRLLDGAGNVLTEGGQAIADTVSAIRNGSIVAVKGLGGFHLLCDATNTHAVETLRKRKRRPRKPFAVLFPDMEALETVADLSEKERELITSREKPIVLLPKAPHSNISGLVAPGIDRIGAFLPYTPMHHLLLEEAGVPLVATSANLSDEPIIRNSTELLEKLGNVADLLLDHDREILNANDDSVLQMAGDERITLRLSRGYAPRSIKLPFRSSKKILAVGANQKNSMALLFEDTVVLSPHIGDLNSLEAFEFFERTLDTFKRFYDLEPEVIVCDKHPGYMTTQWAGQYKAEHPACQLITLQHHYAHLLAGMAEFRLNEPVLGFAFDGTGYGDDGTLWGGEVMIADNVTYSRLASLAPFRLLGGEKAIKEPRRAALALLFESYTLTEILSLRSPAREQFTETEIIQLHRAWGQGINAPLTSSMGRLFDAVASLAGIVHLSGYEGESGLKMEQYVVARITESFPFEVRDGTISLGPMIKAMGEAEDKKVMVSMFFNTVVEMIFHFASRHPELPLLFSGGVFQNRVLIEKIMQRCQRENRTCYLQKETAVNDGGIALGQAWYALHHLSLDVGCEEQAFSTQFYEKTL